MKSRAPISSPSTSKARISSSLIFSMGVMELNMALATLPKASSSVSPQASTIRSAVGPFSEYL